MSESYFLDYDLPKRLIAQQPLRNRSDARLMVLDRQSGSIDHRHVRDLPEILQAPDRLVLNDTKVLPAQLIGRRAITGGKWQGLFLHEQNSHWCIVCKTRGHLAPGDKVLLEDREGRPTTALWLLERLEQGQWLAHVESDLPTEEVLEKVGRVPLPHYIRGGKMVDSDVSNYQTVFARRPGAVAAPTAGLHFTRDLLQKLKQQGVTFASVTLHVGMGTFRPIADSIESHVMHQEWIELSENAARQLADTRAAGGRIVAIGTTSVRVLESAARIAEGRLQAYSGVTDLFIRPPFQFQSVDSLLTNFHFPRSTLLLLVQAFAGGELLERAYQEAIREEYRFYSYGDAMLVL